MAQKIRISKPGYNAVTETNPDNLVFSSDYNTLKYSASNGSLTININTLNEGIYREVREISHNLGYKPFFKVYVSIDRISNGVYLPTGFFSLLDSNSNAYLGASVDNNKMYFLVTGRNIDTVTEVNAPGTGGGLGGTFNDFHTNYDGDYPVGDTPQNTGQCTGLANLWVDWLGLPHIWGDAKDMYNNADSNSYDKIANSPTNVPIVGDLVCWNSNLGGGAGHVGIATGSGNVNNFTSFDQNWSPVYCHNVDHNYNNVIGWLRPKNQGSGGGGGTIFVHTQHRVQYSVTFKYKIFKNNLGL